MDEMYTELVSDGGAQHQASSHGAFYRSDEDWRATSCCSIKEPHWLEIKQHL